MEIARKVVAALFGALVACAGSGPASAADKPAYLFGINEGATERAPRMVLEARYAHLAQALSDAVGRKVTVDPYTNIALFEQASKQRPYDLVLAKTVDIAALLVREQGYVPLAKISDAYVAGFVADDRVTASAVTELAGQLVLFPAKKTFTSKLGMSMLCQAGMRVIESEVTPGDPRRVPGAVVVRHVDIQEAIALSVKMLGAQYPVGLTNPSVLKSWQGKVVARTPAMPNWTIVAAPTMAEADRNAIREALLHLHEADAKRTSGMSDDEARKASVLGPIKVKQFVPAERAEYERLLDYISKGDCAVPMRQARVATNQ